MQCRGRGEVHGPQTPLPMQHLRRQPPLPGQQLPHLPGAHSIAELGGAAPCSRQQPSIELEFPAPEAVIRDLGDQVEPIKKRGRPAKVKTEVPPPGKALLRFTLGRNYVVTPVQKKMKTEKP